MVSNLVIVWVILWPNAVMPSLQMKHTTLRLWTLLALRNWISYFSWILCHWNEISISSVDFSLNLIGAKYNFIFLNIFVFKLNSIWWWNVENWRSIGKFSFKLSIAMWNFEIKINHSWPWNVSTFATLRIPIKMKLCHFLPSKC